MNRLYLLAAALHPQGTSMVRATRSLLVGALVLVAIAPASAQQRAITVRGTLAGADDQPMPAAHVVVTDGPADTTLIAAADDEGRFSLRVPEPGGYTLYLLGVHHETLGELPLILDQAGATVELDARLAALRPAEPVDSVGASGTFAAFMQGKQLVPLPRRGDGAFARRVQPTADSLAYQAWLDVQTFYGPGQRPVAGTRADRYAFNRQGPFWDEKSDYTAVLTGGERGVTGDSVRIVFDPAALPPPGEGPSLESSNATVVEIARIYRGVEEREQRLGAKAREMSARLEESGGGDEKKQALRDTLDAFLAELRRPIRQRIETAENPLVRQWLMLRYFDELRPPEGDSLLARRVLQEVPPASPLWSFEAGSRTGASNLLFQVARVAGQPRAADAYMQRVYERHPDRDVQVQALDAALAWAKQRGYEGAAGRRYTRLTNAFPNSPQAANARDRYAPDRAIQPGQPVPSFAVTALGDSATTYTDESLAGQPYLLDFWATWCGPCIEEMPTLHEAYEKYASDGFQILSLSFDRERSAIAPFRKNRHAMPWKHAFLEGGFRSRVAGTFEVVGIPKVVLVGPDGTIRATGEAARGDALLERLATMFESNAD